MTISARVRAFPAWALLVLLLIVAVAGLLRLTTVNFTIVDRPVRNDAADYVSYALNLRNFGVYSRTPNWVEGPPVIPIPDAMRPPGYPLLLSPLLGSKSLNNFAFEVGRWQAAMGVVLVLAVFLLAVRTLNTAAALSVTLLTALCPHLVVFSTYLLSETLYTFLLMTVCLVAFRWAQADVDRRGRWALLGGLLLGLCWLVRPTLEHLPYVVLSLCLLLPALRAYRRSGVWLLLGFLTIAAPWMVRNLVVTGRVSDPQLMINTLNHGSYPDFMLDGDPKTLGYPYAFDSHAKAASYSVGAAVTEIARKASEKPWAFMRWYLVGKPMAFLSWEMVEGWGDVFLYPVHRSPYLTEPLLRLSHSVMKWSHSTVACLGVLGMLLVWTRCARRYWDDVELLTLRAISFLLLYAIVLHTIGAPFPRYSIPFRPQLYLLAAAAAVTAFRAVSGTGRRARVIADNPTG